MLVKHWWPELAQDGNQWAALALAATHAGVQPTYLSLPLTFLCAGGSGASASTSGSGQASATSFSSGGNGGSSSFSSSANGGNVYASGRLAPLLSVCLCRYHSLRLRIDVWLLLKY